MSDELDINEVWSLYAEEGGSALDEVEESLLILQDAPSNTDAVARLFRAMHTYKGNARMLGLSVIESVAHLAEDMIGLVRDEGVVLDEEIVDLLLEATDTLRGMLETSVASHQDAPEEMLGDLCQWLKNKIAAARFASQSGNVAVPAGVVATAPEQVEKLTSQAIVFEPLDSHSLADDTVYRDIFFAMACDVLLEMRAALADGRLSVVGEAAERLRYAAEQVGMCDWLLILQDFLAVIEPDRGHAQVLFSHLQRLYDRDKSESPGVGSARRFFDALELPLGKLSQLCRRVSGVQDVPLDAIAETVGEIRELAEQHGFVRIINVLDKVIAGAGHGAQSLQDHFILLEFLLYEELASVASGVGFTRR